MSCGQDLDVTLSAAAANSRARILQRPRIQTSHNEPAIIFVGESRPYPTSYYGGGAYIFVGESRPYPTSAYYGGGAYGGYSSIQQLQIGVTLEVTPLINPDGLLVMDIHEKTDSFEEIDFGMSHEAGCQRGRRSRTSARFLALRMAGDRARN